MSYQFNSIVNRSESDALKEMIFNRVRERSQGMTEDVHTDIMDVARNSFSAENNPFSTIIGDAEIPQSKPQPQTPADNGVDDIGFPVRRLQVKQQNRVINEQLSSMAVQSTMTEARVGLSNKQGFMGALNFLNSQAAISLARTRADKFEVVA